MKCLLFWSYQPGGQTLAATEPATKLLHFILPYHFDWGLSCTLIWPVLWHIVPNLLTPWAAQPSYSKTMLKAHNADKTRVYTSPVRHVPSEAKSPPSFIKSHLSSNPDDEPVHVPAQNQCTFCQIQSIEQPREKERFSSPARTPHFKYIECSLCGSFACSDCISDFYLYLTNTTTQGTVHWFVAVHAAVENTIDATGWHAT